MGPLDLAAPPGSGVRRLAPAPTAAPPLHPWPVEKKAAMAVISPLNSRPTVAAMLVLTAVTGLIDTFSYLQLGHVFVAYMTGNVIFLGAGLRPGAHPAVAASATALAGFVLGSLTGGRIAAHLSRRPRRWLVAALATEAVILALVALLTGGGQATPGGRGAYVSIALLALAAGLQNSTVRHFGVRDLNTSVLTLTLTGLTADSALGGGPGRRPTAGSARSLRCSAAPRSEQPCSRSRPRQSSPSPRSWSRWSPAPSRPGGRRPRERREPTP